MAEESNLIVETDEMESNDAKSGNDVPECSDPYSYLQRDEFCSERWKIELRNLPKQYGFKELKKYLMKMGTQPHKIKKGTSTGFFVFISFKCEADRDKALGVLDGQKWKNKVLKACPANAMKDPLIEKRAQEVEKSTDVKQEAFSDIDVEGVVKNATAPWHDIPYDEQLLRKNEKIRAFQKGLQKDLCYTDRTLKSYTESWTLEDVIPSPVLSHYRNKCEFTIGVHPDTGETTIGFRLSSYKKGSTAVGPIKGLPHIPLHVTEAVNMTESFIRQSCFAPYDPETHEGVWKQLTVRTNVTRDLLMILVLNGKNITDEQLGDVRKQLEAFCSTQGSLSLYLKLVESSGHSAIGDLLHVSGERTILEEMAGLKFQVSPESFFQVNTQAAEKLIEAIRLYVKLDEDTCLLDICCGTGVLGLSLAKSCGEVYGVELVKSAVDDANRNAELNGLKDKCQFYNGKAEDLVDVLTYQTKKKKIVAVIDPPRAGAHPKVLQTLRRCSAVNTIIYVSCDAEAAKKNFIDFARPESKKYRGEAFVPKRFIPVDLFPMTPHLELILVLERVST